MAKNISLKTKLGYGASAFADSCTYTFVNTFFLFFLTTIAGVNPVAAGTIAALGAIWDAVLGPVLGFVSDNFESKYGRRIPFIFVAAFPLAIGVCLMFSAVGFSDSGRILYYGAMTLIFWGSFSTFFIPYMALGAELTADYHERTVLRSYAYVFNTLGMTIGMALPTVIVDAIINKGSSAAFAWQMVGIIVGVSAFLALMVSCGILKEKRSETYIKKKREPVNLGKSMAKMVKGYMEVLSLRPLRILIIASILFLVAYTINSADRMYYLNFNIGLTGVQITMIMFLLSIVGIVLAPFVLNFAKKYDKRMVLIFGLGSTAVLAVGMRFIGVESFWGALVYCLIFSLAYTCYWQLCPAMLYDICELDELVSDKRREGAIVSLQSISEAVSAAVSMQVLGLILEFSGFDGTETAQSENALIWLENSFSIIPAVFLVLAMILIIIYPINKGVFEEILRQLAEKKEGVKADYSRFKKRIF